MLDNDSVGMVDVLGLARESQIDDPKNPLTYSCNCGWIDWGHAKPDGAERLLDKVIFPGQPSAMGRGHRVTYHQHAGIDILGTPFRKGVYGDYYVRDNRLLSEQDGIALGIFKEVSEAFERSQSGFIQDGIMHSAFSEEDLVSNLIGFYRAVRRYSVRDINGWCKVIRNRETNHKIWRNGGAPTWKNYSWMPVYHQEAARKSGCCPYAPWFPEQFRAITEQPKGWLWRDWIPALDEPRRRNPRSGPVQNPREYIRPVPAPTFPFFQ